MNFFQKIFFFLDDLCYALDFFKSPFTFHFSRKRRLISHKFGSLLSIFIIIYLLNEIFFSDMIQKTNPSIIVQKVFGAIRPKINYNSSNFEAAIGLFDFNLTNYQIDNSEFEIKATQIKINYSEANKKLEKITNTTNLDLKICTDKEVYVSHSKIIYTEMKCLYDFELETNGYVNEIETSYFKFDFYICNNATSKTICKPKEKILEKVRNKYFDLHYIDYNINYNNFSHPIVFTPQSEFLALDSNYKKSTYIHLNKFEFFDDYDIIGSNPHISKGFTRNSIFNDFSLNEGNFTESIASFIIMSAQETQQNIRNYQKLPQLLANIGGSASFFISIGFILMSFFHEWSLRVSLFKNLYQLERSDKENSEQNNENKKNYGFNEDNSNDNALKNKGSKEENQNFNEISNFYKVEMKNLKADSFVLEKYSLDEEFTKKNKQKKKLSLWKHIIFKLKFALGLKLNENNQIYQMIEQGYNNIINGSFIFEKLQELECMKKIIFSEKEIILMKSLKFPKLDLEIKKLSQNILKDNYFGLYPINFIDEKLKIYDDYTFAKLFQEWKFEKEETSNHLSVVRKLSLILSAYKNEKN